MMHESLPAKLRVLRARRGLTLIEAAEKIGIGRDTLSDLERANRHPVMPTLAKIAEGYGVPVEDLLDEPALAGKAEASDTGPSEEKVRDLVEVAREVRDHIDAMADQYLKASRRSAASEGIPQVYFVEAESKIVDLFSELHRDAAPQVLSMLGLELRSEIARLEQEKAEQAREIARLREENAQLRDQARVRHG